MIYNGYEVVSILKWLYGGIGLRSGLKIRTLMGSRFDSEYSYHLKYNAG